MFSNKDKRGEDSEEVDLTQMINDYEEDRSLRKKIEEMKLKKSTAVKEEEKIVESEESQPYEDKVIDDLENTIIIDPVSEDDFSNEDLGETVVIDTKSLSNVKDQKKAVTKKQLDKKNKMILYGIIGTVSVLLIVGGIVCYNVFFKGDAKTEEKTDTEKTTTKKKTTTTKKKDTDSIKDNSSKIAQLKGQKDSYEAQLRTEQANLETAKAQATHFSNIIDTENAALATKQNNINTSQQNEIRLKSDYDSAKKLSDASPDDQTLKTMMETAKVAWDGAISATKNYQADYDRSLSTTIPDAIKNRDNNNATVKACQATIDDLNAKISAVDADLAKYQ